MNGARRYCELMTNSTSIKVRRSDKAIKPILAACYPNWNGRKITIKAASTYRMANYWADGSRDEVKAYSLVDGQVAETLQAASNPMNGAAHAELEIPAGVLLVEHSVFCGQDAGVTIYVHPSNLRGLLPASW